MNIKLYGVRGSLPAPLKNQEYKTKILEILEIAFNNPISSKEGISNFYENLPEHLKFTIGGDTTCLSISSKLGQNFMLDMGTGARTLGYDLMATALGKGKGRLNIFVTHTHWDHIQGLPFFAPVYIPGNEIHFYSPFEDLEQRLILQQTKEFFPMPFHGTPSQKFFHHLKQGDITEFDEGIKVEFYPLKHPGGSYAYKFTKEGKTFIFATDAEFIGDDLEAIINLTHFFGRADILIIDSQYTLDESFKKFDWGHTAFTMAVNCATIWNVKNLVLTHHEPAYNDKKVDTILEDANQHKKELGGAPLNIILAREGLHFEL